MTTPTRELIADDQLCEWLNQVDEIEDSGVRHIICPACHPGATIVDLATTMCGIRKRVEGAFTTTTQGVLRDPKRCAACKRGLRLSHARHLPGGAR